jgi:L-alanine-DL-glutamate epimerase-like enolase superfamily enzyme
MTVAGGEQDSSWHRWHWMATHRAVDLLQPDLYYNGGMIRCLRLARLAQRLGLPITPHSPATGANALPMLHFASITVNAGPHQEYAFSPEIRAGKVALPKAPGMGINLDDRDVRRAETL